MKQKQRNNDKKNFIWNAIGLSMNAFNSLFFLIAVKYINGMNEAGVFTYSFSLISLFYVISTYYTRTYQVSNYNNNKSFNQYLSSRVIFSIVSYLLIILFILINKFSIFKCQVILLLMLFRTIEAISDCFYGLIQEKKELYKTGISLFVKGILGLLLFIIVDYLTKNILLAIFSLSVVNILLLLLYDYRLFKKYNLPKISFDKTNLKLICKEALPIFIFTFLSIYLANLQKYILTYYVADDIQTIFGILIMPATMLSLVGNYLIMPFVEHLNEYFKNKKYKLFYKLTKKIILSLIAIGVLCVAASYLLGIPILNIIYSINLNSYRNLLLIIIIASVMNSLSIVISNIMIILNENKTQLFIYALVALTGTIINVFLISKYLINGAAYAYLIVYAVMLTLYFTLLFYKGNKTLKRKR